MQISIISLLLSLEAHHDALRKILNESHVREGIETKDLEYMVGQIAETNTITFKEVELTTKGKGNVKPLHITVECPGIIISRVFIDNSLF